MAIIKCKMCGGDITIATDKTFGTCEYCGSTMTLPKVDDDQRAAAFNRGNHFRRIGEFDKALAVYERIVAEDNTDAEAHWCCALCRFGIEYVEDPATYEYLPTCHRASFDSILEDVDYLAAVEYSDGITRRQYQKDAAKIAEVQRGILATSSQEEPFDVFICYKESDAEGNRTRDSLLAQEVYYQLTEQGYRVFFSRITLEDKVGAQYEPYIFAALNSAKVMVAIGTKEEHFNAVWVKNEWSRFLALMKKDRSKLLLPCYRDMDPYDMPEALSVLQSYDMGKIGFIQDLVRGIGKVLRTEPVQAVKETVVVQSQQTASTNIAPLLKRAFMFLEDGEWERADDFCEQVLNIDPECAEAYLGKVLVEEECKSLYDFIEERIALAGKANAEEKTVPADEAHVQTMVDKYELKNFLTGEEIRGLYRFDLSYMSAAAGYQKKYFEEEAYWKNHKMLSRAVRFAEGEETEVLRARERVFSALNESIKAAESEEESACQDLQARYAAHLAVTDGKVAQLYAEAQKRRENYYQQWAEVVRTGTERSALESAAHALAKLDGYKDSQSLISLCNERIDELNAAAAAEAEAKRQAEAAEAVRQAAIKAEEERLRAIEAKKRAAKNKRIAAFVAAVAVVAIVAIVVVMKVVIPDGKYNDAVALMEKEQYSEAIEAFEALDGYKDSLEKIALCKDMIFADIYNNAVAALESGDVDEAIALYLNCGSYRENLDIISAWREKLGDSITFGMYHTVGLQTDGTVIAVGENSDGQCDVSSWSDVVAVDTDHFNTIGLREDGTVVAAGASNFDEIGASAWSNIVSVALGVDHAVGLRVDGTVVAVGYNDYGQCDVEEWKNIVAISAGTYHTVGLCADGTVVATGANECGQCDVSDWSDIVEINACAVHTVGLKKDGTVVAVGENSDGQCDVSGWSDIVAVEAGLAHTVGLKSDGTVVATGWNEFGQCNVDTWTNIVAIASDWLHTAGFRTDGTIVVVGDNIYGQCDISDWSNIKVPQ